MAEDLAHIAWKVSFSMVARLENINKIKAALEQTGVSSASGNDAYTLENELFYSVRTEEEYLAGCEALFGTASEESRVPPARPETPGIRIGKYERCHHIGEGITSEVYRTGDRALKVVVRTNVQPHDATREAAILGTLHSPCISLLETFRDHEQRFVLVFPYMPLTLDALMRQKQAERSALSAAEIGRVFRAVLTALSQIHDQGIIHRDIKPTAVLLEPGPQGNVVLGDFGASWHPILTRATEPANSKVLDIGTGPYRAPEALFGNASYGTAVDMWALGVMLAECSRRPSPDVLFISPPTHEDGSQLGLLASIFQTIGSPTRETWPEASHFRTPPFGVYREYDHRPWNEVLPDVDDEFRQLIAALVKYESSSRATPKEAMSYKCLKTYETSN